MNRLARIVGAIVAGGALVLAFPPYGQWYVAVLVPALVTLVVRGQSVRFAGLLGLLTGSAFFVPLLYWTGLDVGPIPWLLLSIAEALFFVLLGIASMLVQRVRLWPLWIAAVWVGVEALRGRFPYGGFTWGKLAFSQGEAPTLGLASIGGSPIVSFVVALAGALLAAAVVILVGSATEQKVRRIAAAAGVTVAAAGVVAVGPVVPQPDGNGDSAVVAVIQGNVPQLGLDYVGRAREITGNHVAETHRLAEDIEAGRVDRPDFVVWPENSSDINPYTDRETYDAIDGAVRAVGVPVLVSAIVPTEDERNVRNTSIQWDPVTGPGDTYVKRHPMPFGEYIPFREIARRITDAVERQPRDHVAGDSVGVFEMGPAVVGNVICFEVAFDDIVRDAVAEGGEVITVQTNNAGFGDTPMTEQMLAMSQLRAVEHGRPVIVSALSGVSAIVQPDGSVADRLELFTRGTMVAEVRLYDATTVATTVGAWPEWALTAAAVVAAAWGWRRGRTRADADESTTADDTAAPKPIQVA